MYDNLRIAVIGDVMLDLWREAGSAKLSLEAPVVDILNPVETFTLGGAGNVARILAGLEIETLLFGVLGSDRRNEHIYANCEQYSINYEFVYDHLRYTTVKERICCHGQQLCRISTESTEFIADELAARIIGFIGEAGNFDGIIIADYDKGMMSELMIEGVLAIAKEQKIPVLVDPKDRNFWLYKGCTIFKPNKYEISKKVADFNGDPRESLVRAIGCEYLVITSERGMAWSDGSQEQGDVEAHEAEVVNVSGCGDAAAAVMLLEYAKHKDIERAVKMANYAAHLIVERERTGYLELNELEVFMGEAG